MNKSKNAGPLLLDHSLLRSVFNYDPETGVLTRVSNGKVAGYLNKHKYSEVGYGGYYYSVRPLIWFYMTEERVPEGFYINSEDQSTFNNKWDNLSKSTSRNCGFIPTVDPAEKACTICKVLKPIEVFQKIKFKNNPNRKYGAVCKDCERQRSRDAKLIRTYGIDSARYDKMAFLQESKCAICKITSTNLVVDHCHSTGRVRGLLCKRCNFAIGLFDDSITVLNSAKCYLEDVPLLEFCREYEDEDYALLVNKLKEAANV